MKIFQYLSMLFTLLFSINSYALDGVNRAVFTSAIDNREPTDEVSKIDNTTTKVYYFTEIRGLKGTTLTHRWEKDGQVHAKVTFNIGGDRWRVWSSKNLQPEWTGEWQAMVVDEAGNVLTHNSFSYTAANNDAPAEATPEAASDTSADTDKQETTEAPQAASAQ